MREDPGFMHSIAILASIVRTITPDSASITLTWFPLKENRNPLPPTTCLVWSLQVMVLTGFPTMLQSHSSARDFSAHQIQNSDELTCDMLVHQEGVTSVAMPVEASILCSHCTM
ncbi:hypothetical protein Pelo_16315 [Pelomyxa schiedti]|nr:hypothetical protein Pelo_16315 [Pelomyxa schiedti]